MRANPAITAFNAGELSPLMGGRPDLEPWKAGLSHCVNLIPRVQGALQRAAGSVFVGTVKDSAARSWLAPFVFSQGDAFVLEFGPGYIRFFRNRGRLTTGGVSPEIFEIETPYLADDLTRRDGSFGIRFEQSGDVVYLACAGHPPMTLSRRSNLDWLLAPFQPVGGPFQDRNRDEALTVSAAGDFSLGGTVTLTASGPVFDAGHVGGLFELDLLDGADVRAWQVRTTTDVGDERRADFRYYRCTQTGPVDTGDKPAICGEELPVHTRGRRWDGTGEEQKGDGAVGSIGVEWEFLHAGYGHLQITAVAGPTQASGVVLARLPEQLASQPTHRWAHGAWSAAAGWPDNVCFFRERLSWFRGQQVWQSTAGDFANFEARVHGEVLADCAVILSIQSVQGNPVEWVMPTRSVLLIGTNGGEHSLRQQTTQQPYGPGNTQQNPETAWGGLGVEPVLVGAGVVFVEKLGRRLRLLVPGQDGYEALDLNRHRGLIPPVIAMAWQQTPHESIWCVCDDGSLQALTLNLEQQVLAWRRHSLGGTVESVAVIPSPDGRRDDVWLIVRRLINGAEQRHVEVLAAEHEPGEDQALAIYANSALTYDDAPTLTLNGLDHLEGEVIRLKTDGAAHPDRMVTDGSVTLARPASRVVAGLAAPYGAQLMPLEAGATLGTAQGRPKRIHRVTVRLLDSLGGRFGPAPGACDPLQYRRSGSAMDAAPALWTGDLVQTFPGGFDGAATIALEGEDVFPFTLIALFPELATHEG
jgi:hypothetical protein